MHEDPALAELYHAPADGVRRRDPIAVLRFMMSTFSVGVNVKPLPRPSSEVRRALNIEA